MTRYKDLEKICRFGWSFANKDRDECVSKRSMSGSPRLHSLAKTVMMMGWIHAKGECLIYISVRQKSRLDSECWTIELPSTTYTD